MKSYSEVVWSVIAEVCLPPTVQNTKKNQTLIAVRRNDVVSHLGQAVKNVETLSEKEQIWF